MKRCAVCGCGKEVVSVHFKFCADHNSKSSGYHNRYWKSNKEKIMTRKKKKRLDEAMSFCNGVKFMLEACPVRNRPPKVFVKPKKPVFKIVPNKNTGS